MSDAQINVPSKLVSQSLWCYFLILLFGISFTGCSINLEENFDCSSSVNDSINIRVKGNVRDVGFTDMIYTREIKLSKGRDSINVDLGNSEFREVLMKELQVDSLKSLFVFYSRDKAKKVIVDFNRFKIERSKLILDSIRDPHKLEGKEFVLCEIPGTYVK